jgi:hypothetical protein
MDAAAMGLSCRGPLRYDFEIDHQRKDHKKLHRNAR